MNLYLPFLNGVYSTAPGLQTIPSDDSTADKIFDLDEEYAQYLGNKKRNREEGIEKYYHTHLFETATKQAVNDWILKRIVAEYPDTFSTSSGKLTNHLTKEIITWDEQGLLTGSDYKSLFDALCSQLQEDMAVVQMTDSQDWLAAIHLCSPNHWDPGEKIGKPFDQIHAPVPDIARTVKHYEGMLKMIISKGPFTRFAWGISTDTQLNHHPEPRKDSDKQIWQGRSGESNTFFIRTEKQNLIGIPQVNAFIFTIRTYFYDVDQLNQTERAALLSAVRSMSPETLQYKGLLQIGDALLQRLT